LAITLTIVILLWFEGSTARKKSRVETWRGTA
jgi:hypothetical protein